jgi:hypothetical protein
LKVICVGASLPVLLVARELASHGHTIMIVGRSEGARSSAPIGPQYLWATPEVMKILAVDFDRPTAEVLDRISTKRVMWQSRDKIIGTTGDAKVDTSVIGYNSKTGSSGMPCGGQTQFSIIEEGFEWLRKLLMHDLKARMLTVRFKATDALAVEMTKQGVELREPEEIHTGRVCVNGAPRDVWERLRGRPCPTLTIDTHFSVMHEPPCEGADQDMLIYNGDHSCPWFRCSYDWGREAWVYESRRALGDRRVVESQVIPAKMAAVPPTMEEKFAVHVGRWAEMKKELLVSDVVKNLRFYRTFIEGLACLQQLEALE